MALTDLLPNPNDPTAPPPLAPGTIAALGGNAPAPQLPGLKPLVTSPRQQQEQALQTKISAFENPAAPKTGFWHNLGRISAKIGNVAGDVLAPGTTAMIPGTDLNRQIQESQRVRELAGLQGQDQAEQNNASKRGLEGAQAGYQAAEAGAIPSREALEKAQADEAESKVNNPDLATAYAHAVNQSIKNGGDPSKDPIVQQLGDAITAIQKQPLPKGMEHIDIVGPDGKPMQANYNPQSGQTTDSTGKVIANPVPYEKPNQAGMITMIAPDPNNPGGGIVQRLGAGAHVTPGSQTAAGVNTMNTPTTNQRTAAGRAETVLAMVPEVTGRIDATASQMGPEMGRWNDFMQGKIGADNPQFAALRSDLLMMSSAVALAHAQGRLPENLREEFDKAINAPKQTPENLKATINAMVPWLEKVQQQGERPGTAQNGGGAQTIRAVDLQGKVHEAPAGTPLPKGWKLQ